MSDLVAELNSTEFGTVTASGVVLADFWAPWCAPCRMQGPILDDVATAVGDKAKVVKVNVDDSMDVAARYGVQSIPTLVLLKDGSEVRRFVGVQAGPTLVQAIEGAQ